MIAKSRVDMRTPEASKGARCYHRWRIGKCKVEMGAEIEVSSPGVLSGFHERSLAKLKKSVDHSSLDVDLLIVRDGISEEAISMLSDSGITTYRRFERGDLEILSRITGARILRDPVRASGEDLGVFTSGKESQLQV